MDSDINLALKGDELNDAFVARIADDIDGLDLVYLADLVLINQTENENLLREISKTGQIFYMKDLLRVQITNE